MFITRFFGAFVHYEVLYCQIQLKVVEHAKLYGTAAANEYDVTQSIIQSEKTLRRS